MRRRAFSLCRPSFLVATFLLGGLGVQDAAALEVTRFGDEGFLRVDYQLQARAGMRDQGPDPTRSDDTTDFYLRRNRLSLIGAANEMFGAVVQLEFNGGQQLGDTRVLAEERDYEFTALDAFATVKIADYLQLRVGKTKHVLTREVQEGCFDPLSIDRSPFILGAFSRAMPELTTRDVGVVLWGNVYDRMIQYRLSAMRGNDFGSAMPDDIGYRYTGRVHVTLFDQEAGVVYRGTYLGEKRVLTIGAGFERQQNAVYSAGTTGAEDYQAYTYDIFYEHPTEYGTFTVSGAYLETDFGEAGLRGVVDAQGTGGERTGFYWKAGYMLRSFQVFGRFERWSFANLDGVPGQKLDWMVAGLNYFYKGENARLTLEYAITDLEKEPAKDFDTILLQAQVQF
jgi:hypothetical protein